MKNLFVICLVSFVALLKAQDTSFCYNAGNFATKETVSDPETSSPVKQENSLILMPYAMKEKEVVLMMKEKNNSSINKLLRKVKLSRDFETVSIAAVPETLLGATFLGIVSSVGNTAQSGQQKQLAVGLLAVSAVCLTSSLCFKLIHKKNYKKAIREYNNQYN